MCIFVNTKMKHRIIFVFLHEFYRGFLLIIPVMKRAEG